MKNKMKKFAVGALAAFMTVVSAVGTWASSAVFSSYGLSEPYTGDMQVTVEATVSKLDGSSTKEAIEGMKFSVYQVWTLDNDGRVVMNEKFAGVTVGEKTAKEAIENLVDLQDQTPASETYDLTYALADVEDKGAAFTGYGEGTVLTTDAAGKLQINGLPFGGYLIDSDEQVYFEHEREDGTKETKTYTAVPFLASVPIATSVDQDGNRIYSKSVNATVKVTAVGSETETERGNFEVKISKVDIAGDELPGATLRVWTADGKLAHDANTGEELQWVSTNQVRVVNLEPGIYCLEEIAPPPPAEGVEYYIADKVWFQLTEEGKVNIVRDASGQLADHNGNTLQGESIYEEGDPRRRPDDVAAVVMVNEPRYEPDIKKFVETAATPETSFVGAIGNGEVFTYRITTEFPSARDNQGRKRSNYTITDVLEPVLTWPTKTPQGSEITDPGEVSTQWIGIQVGDTRYTDEELMERVTLDKEGDRDRLQIVFNEKDIEANAGKAITIVFFAQVKQGADLTAYASSAGGVQIPNEVDNTFRRSGKVYVTPPSRRTSTSTNSSNPVKTGDDNNMLLWIVVIAVAVAALFAIIAIIRRRKMAEDQEE